MKKVILFSLALCFLALPVNAKKPKLARSVWFLFEKVDNMEKQPNDSVVVSYKTVLGNIWPNNPDEESFWPQPHIIMTIQNNTERVIYADLQQSFIVINGELYPLYIPTSEVKTQSSTSITGVNFGLVGVGSAGTTANTKIVHAERYVIIPGETKKSIDIPLTKWETSFVLNNKDGKIKLEPAGGNGETNPNSKYYCAAYHKLIQYFVNVGDVKNYEYDDNPMTLDMRLCYSFNDNMTPNYTNRSVYYTAHIVGSDYRKGGKFGNKIAIERATEFYPPFNEYLTSPRKLYFHFWTPEFMPKNSN